MALNSKTACALLCVFVFLCALGAAQGPQTLPTNPATSRSRNTASLPLQEDLAAAERGNVAAELNVAKDYYNGKFARPNYAEALKWFRTASGQGSVEAKAWLGSLYLYGRGVLQDSHQALTLIQAAADANDPVGLRFLALMYQGGFGVPRDYSKAVTLFSAAAAKHDPNSHYQLAICYQRGFGTPQNSARALSLLLEAARLGDAAAQFQLGEMYQKGDARLPGATSGPNYGAALKMFEQSAEQGNVAAAFMLAELYKKGLGATADNRKAVDYYRQAAARGYTRAQLALGKWNEEKGQPANLVQAYVWYTLASKEGDTDAGNLLASLASKMSDVQVEEARARVTQWESRLSQ